MRRQTHLLPLAVCCGLALVVGWHRVGLALSASLPKPPARVTAVLEVLGQDSRSRVVEPAEILCSGEHFRLEVEVSQPLYVYVAEEQDGKITVLYPAPGDDPLRLRPGKIHQMPEDTSFELGEKRGLEQIFVVANQLPLAPEALKKLVAEALSRSSTPPKPPRDRVCIAVERPLQQGQPAPDGAAEVYRDIVLRQGLKPQQQNGASLVRIPILHR